MRDLKLLILHQRNFSGSLSFLSSSLHWLSWHGYPFSSLPSNFEPNKLVELNMSNSIIERLWKGMKDLPCLKRVDLSNSESLVETPYFEGIPNLERLDLTGCTKLMQVHPSIGLLKKLAFLSLRNCTSLVSLDLVSVSNTSSLRVLYLSGCTKLKNTPDFTGISNLEYLDLENCTSLSTIHESIGALVKLKFLSLRYCTNLVRIPNSVNTMTSLTTLDLKNCFQLENLPLGQRSELEESVYLTISGHVPSSHLEFMIFLDLSFCNLSYVPDAIGGLRRLERLNLQGNHFASLPETISELFSLAYLNLSHCHEIQCLPLPPSKNASLVGRYYETVSGSRNHRSGLYIFDCSKFVKNELQLAHAWFLRLVEEPRHFRCGFDIVIHGSVIPKLFNYQFLGDTTIRIVHCNVDDNWIGFSFCVAFVVNCHQEIYDSFSSPSAQSSYLSSRPPYPLYLSFESQHTEESFNMPLSLDLKKNVGSECIWLIYISRPHCHFVKTGVHITFKASPGLEIRKWGLHQLFKQDIVAMKRKDYLVNHRLRIHYVQETQRWSSYSEKLQLPYNWLVSEEEEIENMGAKDKENNLSIIGLG